MTIKFYHGSYEIIPTGTKLGCRDGYENTWGSADCVSFYDVLETYRPATMIPHAEAVFMVADPDDVDAAGGMTDVIYEIEPIGPVERHDLYWSTEISSLLDNYPWLKKADLTINPDAFPDLKQAAAHYWNGVPHQEGPLWEYLAREAVITELVENNLVAVSTIKL